MARRARATMTRRRHLESSEKEGVGPLLCTRTTDGKDRDRQRNAEQFKHLPFERVVFTIEHEAIKP